MNGEVSLAGSSQRLHEPEASLHPDVLDRHRAIVSLMEELEAVDWYDQRIAAADDPELKTILAHNRDEEKEHAAMILEWLRRRDPVLDGHLRTFLFSEGPIEEAEHTGGPESGDGSLRIGGLRKAEVSR